MDYLIQWISSHSHQAHWVIFGLILLAGVNLPISADLLIVCAAVLAANIIPDNLISLYLAISLGCYFSAWIAYWMGRTLGWKLLSFKWISKILTQERLIRIARFYSKHGFWTLFIGRFIPFGVRNCIFMTTGISRMSFLKFAFFDLIACFTWSSLCFYIFYKIGKNYETLCQYLKTFNIVIFCSFGVTLIGLIWYKRRKLNAASQVLPKDQGS